MATETEKKEPREFADKDGQFRRQVSSFRDFISADPNSKFPAEKGRYVIYISYGCPWAHRVNIVLHLKGLTDDIRVVKLDYEFGPDGWFFSGRKGTDPEDPVNGFKLIRDIYKKADPEYNARFTVPCLFDTKLQTIVNNESSEIIRMLYTEFDALVPEDRTEAKRPLFPKHLQTEIEEMNDWVYNDINNGVYKTGFATSQDAYEEHIFPLFKGLDRLEKHLETPGHSPYLFGEYITEADIRLYTTIVRFDVAYFTIFRCNLKMIRYDYPNLHKWLRRLYWDTSEETNGGAFQSTTKFDQIKAGYSSALKMKAVPAGPLPDIYPL